MFPARIKRIIIISLFILALLAIASIFVLEGRFSSGVLAGGLLASLNLYFLSLMMMKVMDDKPQKGAVLLRFFLKYFLMGGLLVAAVFLINCDPLGIAIGFSNIFFAIVIDGLFLKAPKDE